MSNSNTQRDRKYNVITNGVGYINRIRKVQPEKGDPYLACDVALFQHVGDNVEYVRFSCVIRGRQAKEIIRTHFTSPGGEVVHPKDTVVVANMNLGGISVRKFVYRKGEKKGQTGISLRAALLSIKWLRIGDIEVDLEYGGQTANGTARQAANGRPAFVREMLAEFDRKGHVSLSKDHPEFEARKAWLKENGFKWNAKKGVWVKPDTGDVAAEARAPQDPPPEAVPEGARDPFPDFDDFDDDIPF